MTATDPEALLVLLTRAQRGVLSTTEADALRGHVEQLHARVAELEQQAAIDRQVMAKGDADWNEARDAVQKWRQHAEQWQKWGEQHRDRADRYRDRLIEARRRAVRYRLAWRSARQRAAVLSAEVTRRAPLLGEYAASWHAAAQRVAELEAALDRVRATVHGLCDEPHPTHDHICPDDVRRYVLAALAGPARPGQQA